MPLSEQSLLSRRELANGETMDPFVKTSYVYTISSCMLLVVVFFVVLPGALVPYFRKVRYLSELPRMEDQLRPRSGLPQGPLTLCQLNVASFARPEPWAYRAEHIPTAQCTHIVFSVPGLKDWFNDINNYDAFNNATRPVFWSAIKALRYKENARILVSIGAFEDTSSLIGAVVSGKESIAQFSRNVVRWVLGNSLDGALFSGIFPATGRTRNAMVKLVKKMSTLFRVQKLLLGLIVNTEAEIFQRPETGTKLAHFVDLFVVKVSKEASFKEAAESASNMVVAMEKMKECGVPANKLIATLSLEGTFYRLADSLLETEGKPSARTLPYYAVCDRIRLGTWDIMFDKDTQSSYIHRNHEWINFDDGRSISAKMSALQNTSASGVLLWDITADDFQGLCGTPHPLVTAVYNSLMALQMATLEANASLLGGSDSNKLA